MQKARTAEMAMFRYGLIAPVLNGTYSEPSKLAYYRSATEKPLTLPNGSKVSYSASTLSYWELLYRRGGFEGLYDKNRSDKGRPRKLSQDAMDAILALKHKFPRINATMIRERLIEQGVFGAKDVSLCTVQRFVRSRTDLIASDKTKVDRKAFEAERVCELWQADTMYGPYVKSATGHAKTYLISAIDDKSRLIVASRFHTADTALNFQAILKEGAARYGIPEKLYVDNGGPYKNDQLSAICGRIGCVLLHAPVRDGAAKGKIERWHRTLRDSFLSVLEPAALASIEALNASFTSWLTKYNTKHHSSINMTPMDAYEKGSDSVRTPKSLEWLDEKFLNTISRKVKNDATVSINNISYDVPMAFIGTKVELRFLPANMADAHIFHDNQRYGITPTNKQDNAKTKRQDSRYHVFGTGEEGEADASTPLSA
jgi:transposase InsO family protein